ncbi:MAG: hypothetical protein C0463_05910 [Idiomarina sp.]|nr:hypothetical protein [Idiomarina sp.]
MTQSDWRIERQQLTSQLKQQEAELEMLREEIARLRAVNQGSLLAKAKRLLKGAKPAVAETDDRQLLKDSTLFDADWYLKTYKDVASHPKWSADPEGHYLSFAITQLRRPGPAFDTEWYLSYYPDVKAAGVNPLVHYILHGEQEGRVALKPDGGAVSHMGVGRVDYLNRKLWAGYANVAVPGLERVSELGGKRTRAKALWYLARWHYNQGAFDKAAEFLENMVEIQEGLNRRTVVALNRCYTHLKDYEAAAELMQADNIATLAGKTLPYLQANAALALPAEQATQERLRAINNLFWNQGLAGIEVKADAAGTSFTIDHIQVPNVPKPVAAMHGRDELPLISIVIPAYNAESTIHIALESLLAQSWHNIEIIVVDDCSKDGTAATIESFCQRDSRVRLLRHEVNQGAYPARNFGMQHARGEFVTVHDSDDWSHPQKLEKQALVLINDDTKVASVSNWVRVKNDMRFVGSWFMDENFLEKNHSSTLFRKRVVDELGGWDNVNVAGDSEYIWRVEQAYGAGSIVSVLPDAPLSFALELDDSLTRNSATHVRTIHYGLRRLYREAARWWHNSMVNQGKIPAREGSEFVFPIPLGNKRGSAMAYEVAFVADFTNENIHIAAVVEKLAELAQAHSGNVVLFHWPDFKKWEGAPITSEVFDLCHQYGIAFCHHGQALQANTLIFFNPALWENKLDVVPRIEQVQEVKVIKVSDTEVGQELPARIKTYFENEGKDV